jgi:hypothetical protein
LQSKDITGSDNENMLQNQVHRPISCGPAFFADQRPGRAAGSVYQQVKDGCHCHQLVNRHAVYFALPDQIGHVCKAAQWPSNKHCYTDQVPARPALKMR